MNFIPNIIPFTTEKTSNNKGNSPNLSKELQNCMVALLLEGVQSVSATENDGENQKRILAQVKVLSLLAQIFDYITRGRDITALKEQLDKLISENKGALKEVSGGELLTLLEDLKQKNYSEAAIFQLITGPTFNRILSGWLNSDGITKWLDSKPDQEGIITFTLLLIRISGLPRSKNYGIDTDKYFKEKSLFAVNLPSMLFAYFLAQGKTPEQAIEEIKKIASELPDTGENIKYILNGNGGTIPGLKNITLNDLRSGHPDPITDPNGFKEYIDQVFEMMRRQLYKP